MRSIKIIAFTVLFQLALPISANAFCFEQAGAEFQIDPILLKAIAVHESRLNPATMAGNTNNTVDIGLMGINTVHLRDRDLQTAGYSTQVLLDPCTNVRVGAWLLRKKITRWGETWRAVGAYHSETPEKNQSYQWRVFRVYQGLKEKLFDSSRQ